MRYLTAPKALFEPKLEVVSRRRRRRVLAKIEVLYGAEGTEIFVNVRGRNIEAVIAKAPFMAAKTKSMKKKRTVTEAFKGFLGEFRDSDKLTKSKEWIMEPFYKNEDCRQNRISW